MIVSPIVLVSKPLWYLGRTLVTITWLNTLTADGKARKKQLEILRKTNKTATEVTPIEVIEADSTSKWVRNILIHECCFLPLEVSKVMLLKRFWTLPVCICDFRLQFCLESAPFRGSTTHWTSTDTSYTQFSGLGVHFVARTLLCVYACHSRAAKTFLSMTHHRWDKSDNGFELC